MSDSARDSLVTAAALALGAAISLGLARFSYALLLPPMRAELGWSYFTAGAMNTVNAAGYLVGALLLPRALARVDARTLLLAGGYGTAFVLAAHGLARSDAWLYALRGLAGVASAATFATGGLLAARLGQKPGARPALVLGLYYGGTGLGIIASALVVPPLSWPQAWWALAATALVANAVMARGTRTLAAPPAGVSATPYTFTITGADGAGCAPARNYSLTVNCASILPTTLPAASLGAFYNQTLTSVGGTSPTLSLSGTPPSGISFNPASGVLSGTPGQTGTFALTFTVADGSGCTHSENYNFVVSCPSLTILPAATTITATSGTPFTALTFTTTGGIPPIAIDIEGDLPNGMAVAGPVLSGTPTELGLFPIVVRAVDASGCQQTKNYTIQVN
jgi:MFS family permease